MGQPTRGFDWNRTIHNIAVGLAPTEDLLGLYLKQAMAKTPKRPTTTALPGSTIGLKPISGLEGIPQMINMPNLGGK